MKFAICELPLFKRHVLLAIGCKEEEAISYFWEYCQKQECQALPDLHPLGCGGWCQTLNHDHYLWVKEENYSIVFHEIVHAAFHACEDVGMAVDQEMIARLVEYMKLNLVDKLEEILTQSKEETCNNTSE